MDGGEGGAVPRTQDDLPRQEATPHLQVKGGHRGRGASGGVPRRWGAGPPARPQKAPSGQGERGQVRRRAMRGQPVLPAPGGRARERKSPASARTDGPPGAQTARRGPEGQEGPPWDPGGNSAFFPRIKQELLCLLSLQECSED